MTTDMTSVSMIRPNESRYIFTDRQHAIRWFNQGFCLTDKSYRDSVVVELGIKTKCLCSECGQERTKFDVKRSMTVDQFLKHEAQKEKAH